MTDSNKGRELDDQKNAENKALDDLDNQAKSQRATKPDLIAKIGDGGGGVGGAGGFNPGVGNPVRGVPPVNTPAAPARVAPPVNNPATTPRAPQQNSIPQNVRPPAAPVNGGGSNTQSNPTPQAEISLPTKLPPDIPLPNLETPKDPYHGPNNTYGGPTFENPLDKIVPPGNGQKPKPTEKKTPPAKTPTRSKPKRKQTENPDEFERTYRKTIRRFQGSEGPPQETVRDGFGNPTSASTAPPNWPPLNNPSPATNPDIVRPTKLEPNPQKKPGKFLPTVPNTRFDPTKPTPPSNPSGVVRQQPRASQQPANNNNTPGNQPAPSRTPGRSRKRQPTRSRQQQSGRSTANSTRAQEAKKQAVEQEVAKLQDRNIGNLPNGLEERLKEVGYTIARGKTTSIRYHGNLPSGSQLHIKNGSYNNGTIEQGRAPANTRLSDSKTMTENVLEGTGLKEVPKGYQVNHNIPDDVYKNDELTKLNDEHRKKSNKKSGVDDQGNLVIMPENAAATKNPDPAVKKAVIVLRSKGRLLKNINHRGPHTEYSKRAKKILDGEKEKLKERYGKLEKAPAAEVEKAVKRAEKQLMDELKDADQKIGLRKYDELPQWVKDYIKPDNQNPDQFRLSETPQRQQNILASNPKLAVALGKAVRRITNEIVDNYTYNYTPGRVPTKQTPQDYAETLAVTTLQKMQGKNGEKIKSAWGDDFKAEWQGQNIEITNPSTGKKLGTIYPDQNKIAMAQPLSKRQAEILDGVQAKAAQNAAAKNNIARGGDGPSRGMQLGG
jgi:hypothetical protein